MHTPRWLVICAFAVASSLAGADAEACSCMTVPPCQTLKDAASVFVGEVASVIGLQGQPPGQFEPRRVKLRVIEAFHGVGTREIELSTGSGAGDCGVPFAVGEKYLVYGYMSGGNLNANICSRTRLVDQAGEDLQYLRSLASGASEGTVYGSSMLSDGDYGLGSVQDRISGLRVSLDDGVRRRDTTTEAGGQFAIRAPAGRYQVSAEAPGMYARVRPALIEVTDARTCVSLRIDVHHDGHVRGRVVTADGKPVPHVAVELDPGSSTGLRGSTGFGAHANARGEFDIGQVAAGRFTLALPGATRIVVSKAPFDVRVSEHVAVGDSVLPSAIRLATITGRVLDEAGRPAAGASVFAQSAMDASPPPGSGVLTDADGRFAIAVIAGSHYRITARKTLADGRVAIDSALGVHAIAGAPALTLRLTVR